MHSPSKNLIQSVCNMQISNDVLEGEAMTIRFNDSRGNGQGADFVARTTQTCAELVQLLKQCKGRRIKYLAIETVGLSPDNVGLAALMVQNNAHGASAAIGICKCLPYEMPFLTHSHLDLDPLDTSARYADRLSMSASIERRAAYGATSRAKIANQPLMKYVEKGNQMQTHAPACYSGGAYIITGTPYIGYISSMVKVFISRLCTPGSCSCLGVRQYTHGRFDLQDHDAHMKVQPRLILPVHDGALAMFENLIC